MRYEAINFAKKFGLFDEQWQPKVIAEMNDYQFKIVKLQGDFIWHDHHDTDEAFIVLDGSLRIDTALDNGLALWVSGDNLWKGAALNALQNAELMVREGWLKRKSATAAPALAVV